MISRLDLPPEIMQALHLVWDFADDAVLSGGTQEELQEVGYECEGESAHVITFVISRRPIT